jgi:hypothetical protein
VRDVIPTARNIFIEAQAMRAARTAVHSSGLPG